MELEPLDKNLDQNAYCKEGSGGEGLPALLPTILGAFDPCYTPALAARAVYLSSESSR